MKNYESYIMTCYHLIFSIGFDPFFLHYWTPTQIRIAKISSTKLHKLKISCDATGGVCKKISRVFDVFSRVFGVYVFI